MEFSRSRAPHFRAGLFQFEGLTPPTLALIRMFGGLLAGSALVSALIAKNPEANPSLLIAYAVMCLLNLAADTLVCLSGAMQFSQLAVGMLLQAVLVAAIAATRRPRSASSRGDR